MTSVPRHVIDPALAAEGAEGVADMLEQLLEVAATRPAASDSVLSTARGLAGYLSVSAGPDAVCEALRTGARAAGTLFTAEPTDASHPGNWRIGWWLAHVVRDERVIDELARTPVEVLRRSRTQGDECQYLFVAALQAFHARAADWGDRLERALDATDPERHTLAAEGFVLNILVPEMELLFHLGLREVDAFQESLGFALQRHRTYWSSGNRNQDPDGLLALGPLALAAVAHDAGMPVDVESGYLPMPLIEGLCGAG